LRERSFFFYLVKSANNYSVIPDIINVEEPSTLPTVPVQTHSLSADLEKALNDFSPRVRTAINGLSNEQKLELLNDIIRLKKNYRKKGVCYIIIFFFSLEHFH
jgi:hypothetical protein